jgi:predicted RNase H-like nuclease (RuvC/YqgF family)
MSDSAANISYKELYEASIMMVQQLNKSLEQQQKSNQSLQEQVTQLQYQLQQLTKLLKGFKSERFLPSAVSNLQPELGFNAEIASPAINLSEVKKISYTRTKKASTDTAVSDNGTRLPDHLRRETKYWSPQKMLVIV